MDHHPQRRLPRRHQPFQADGTPVSRRRLLGLASTSMALGAGLATTPGITSTLAHQSGLFAPIRIEIGAIGLDADIEQIHIVGGLMGTPKDPWHVGWYSQLSFPLQNQNVVLAGHKDWWGIGPVVFWNLGDLEPGNDLTLTSQALEQLTYSVISVERLAAATPPVEYTASNDGEQLTLITCSGDFDGAEYNERLIVRAVLA